MRDSNACHCPMCRPKIGLMNIPAAAMDAAKVAMETVTAPPGVDRAVWLDRFGPYALLAGAIAAAAPYLAAEAWDEGRKHGATYPYGERGLATDDNPYRKSTQ